MGRALFLWSQGHRWELWGQGGLQDLVATIGCFVGRQRMRQWNSLIRLVEMMVSPHFEPFALHQPRPGKGQTP